MKNTTLSLLLVLFVSACSHKTESRDATGTPQFVFTASDVSTASVQPVTGNANLSESHKKNLAEAHKTALVKVVFSSSKAAEFHKFTQDHLALKVHVLVGSEVLLDSVIRTAITLSEIELAFSTPEEAQAFADSLSKK
jgi:hypothetical protein